MEKVECRTLETIKSAIDSNSFSMVIAGAWLPDLPLVYVNSQFERITGYQAEEVIGRNCRLLQGPDTNKEAVAEISQAINNRKPVATNLLNYRKDGSTFWNRFQISPLFGKTGDLEGYMGIQIDMTLDAINAAKEADRQRLETLGNIAGSIAHDIGNALQPIRLMGEELGDLCRHLPPKYRPQAKNCLSILLDHASVGASITQQVLTYAAPNQQSARRENVTALFSTACAFASGLLPKKIVVKTMVAPGFDKSLTATLEANSLNQAFMNLFDNAAKAMQCVGDLTVSLHEDNTWQSPARSASFRMVRIDITDTGCGIPGADLDRIFDPYFTSRPSGQGSGLGLFGVRRLATDWGGKVSAKSTVKQGTTFSLYIPAHAGDPSDG